MKILIFIIALSVLIGPSVQAQQASSCSTPNAHIFIPLIGNVSAEWNCWLQDLVFRFYKARGFDDYKAANFANAAVQNDAADRLDAALGELRSSNPQYFDQLMAAHGLSFKGE